jgi:branched-chain amino acid transport system permease protein
MILFIEQLLNGVQFGMFLFLVSAGLTLIFGIMGVINLAHGSLYMVGAYGTALGMSWTGSFWGSLLIALPASALVGWTIEKLIIRLLYTRDHLDQVLATFGVILFLNELITILFGRSPLFLSIPEELSASLEILPGLSYPLYRLLIILVGLLVAAMMRWMITRTRAGMLIRAGTTHREMVEALGVNITLLNTGLFVTGAVFAGFAGAMAGPLVSVGVGMGEGLLILCFVCIVIGGVGSTKGAFVGSLLIGIVDTLGRAFLPDVLKVFLPPATAAGVGAGVSSMLVYILMALVLIFRPEGLFPVKGRKAA